MLWLAAASTQAPRIALHTTRMLSLVRLHVCSQPYRAALAQGALVQLARCATATSVVPEALPSNLKLADSGLFEPAPEGPARGQTGPTCC